MLKIARIAIKKNAAFSDCIMVFGVKPYIVAFFILLFIIMTLKIRKLSAQLRNRAHFYVARDKNGELWLYMGKPERGNSVFFRCLSQGCCISHHNFKLFGLNENDYANLKWKDEPVEVFVKLDD